MKSYIISICVSSVIVALADILSPKQHQKYIRILLGFFMLMMILAPLPAIRKIRLEPLSERAMENTEIFAENISKQLKENVELDISERLKNEFGIICTASIELDTDDEGQIRGVTHIRLSEKIPASAVNRLKEVYGCDEIEY